MSSPQLTPDQRAYQRHRMATALARGALTVEEAVCRYGCSRKTVYKWWRRWCEGGRTVAAVRDRPRTPHTSPRRCPPAVAAAVVALAQRHPEAGLVRLQRRVLAAGLTLSVHGVDRVLRRAGVRIRRRRRHGRRRYQTVVHHVPGEQVQVDLLTLVRGRYQLTVLDSATRFLAATLLPDKSVHTVKQALIRLVSTLPFPVQTLQTDHGPEFTYAFLPHATTPHPLDVWCAAQGITHRLIPIAYPQANGKVERVHRICRHEFYARYRLRPGQTWAAWLPHFLHHYNYEREHGSLAWRTPAQQLAYLRATPPPDATVVTHV